jgi:RimJ/RimL family protein N-acetyltransferase
MIILETARMILREMDINDVENLQGIFSDPEAMRYYPKTKTVAETEDWIRWNRLSYRVYRFGLWIAILKETGAFVGQCGLVMQRVDDAPEIEIGYLFLRKYWGQGLATEAAEACRDFAVNYVGPNRLGYTRLISLIDPRNLASKRVAEKIGMALEKEAMLFDKRIEVYVFETAAEKM